MKGSLLILLCVIGNVYFTNGYKIRELYRTLNISCYEEDELKKICDSAKSTANTTKIGCACPSVIGEVDDRCVVLYQFITPGVVCDFASRGVQPAHLQHFDLEWWSNSPLISPNRLSTFALKVKRSLEEYFLVNFTSDKCFSATDILESQGLSTKKCFARSSVGQLCSAIVDRLTRGESICEDEVFDDASCVKDAVEQLFDLLSADNDMLTLTNVHTLIGNQLSVDHRRSVQEEDDDHNDHNHKEVQATQNCIIESKLREEFDHIVEDQMLLDANDSSCYLHANDSDDDDSADTNCSLVYNVCRDLILETRLTTEACLAGTSEHGHDDDHGDEEDDDDDDVSQSEAYGYGFLSTLIISVASQLGVITILFSYNNQMAKYLISLLIAIGISSLVTDAILHLLPKAFGGEEEGENDGHGHGDEEGGHAHDKTTIWRGCCALAGILFFYMFELILSLVKKKLEKRISNGISTSTIPLHSVERQPDEEEEYESKQKNGCLNLQMDIHPPYFNPHQGFCYGITSVAWMIILGDGIHNFADGIAIGASFTSSLGIGASTSLAVLFHEVPHEFGDFAILLSSGMKWHVALIYNFLSSIVAIIGMFVGVAIGHASEDSTAWILSIAAGVFLYVALVDLLPGLMEILKECKSQKLYLIYIICHLTGFMIGFVILLLIAIYEEDINNLIN